MLQLHANVNNLSEAIAGHKEEITIAKDSHRQEVENSNGHARRADSISRERDDIAGERTRLLAVIVDRENTLRLMESDAASMRHAIQEANGSIDSLMTRNQTLTRDLALVSDDSEGRGAEIQRLMKERDETQEASAQFKQEKMALISRAQNSACIAAGKVLRRIDRRGIQTYLNLWKAVVLRGVQEEKIQHDQAASRLKDEITMHEAHMEALKREQTSLVSRARCSACIVAGRVLRRIDRGGLQNYLSVWKAVVLRDVQDEKIEQQQEAARLRDAIANHQAHIENLNARLSNTEGSLRSEMLMGTARRVAHIAMFSGGRGLGSAFRRWSHNVTVTGMTADAQLRALNTLSRWTNRRRQGGLRICVQTWARAARVDTLTEGNQVQGLKQVLNVLIAQSRRSLTIGFKSIQLVAELSCKREDAAKAVCRKFIQKARGGLSAALVYWHDHTVSVLYDEKTPGRAIIFQTDPLVSIQVKCALAERVAEIKETKDLAANLSDEIDNIKSQRDGDIADLMDKIKTIGRNHSSVVAQKAAEHKAELEVATLELQTTHREQLQDVQDRLQVHVTDLAGVRRERDEQATALYQIRKEQRKLSAVNFLGPLLLKVFDWEKTEVRPQPPFLHSCRVSHILTAPHALVVDNSLLEALGALYPDGTTWRSFRAHDPAHDHRAI